MKNKVTCTFNIDTGCVEVQMSNGTRLSIDCTSVENELADNMYQRRELDYLIYNAPAAYANLILNGDPEKYLREVRKLMKEDAKNG